MAAFRFRLFATVLPLLGLSLVSGCNIADDKMVMANANQMHGELEPAVLEDQALAAYVQQLGDRVVEAAREQSPGDSGPKGHNTSESNDWMFKDIQFHLVNSKTLNAFTTGGQHVYLYTELFRQCKTEDEFAAVVSHEFAHIYCRHVHNGYNRAANIQVAAITLGLAGAALDKSDDKYWATGIAGVAVVGGQLIGLNYNRRDEDEADAVGFEFYTHAGWDPDQFAGLFDTMAKQGGDSGPNILSSHPKLTSRVTAAHERASKLPASAESWRRGNVVGQKRYEELQARSTRVGKSMPTDESLEKAQTLLASFSSCLAPQETKDQADARAKLLYEYGDKGQQTAVEAEQKQKNIPRGRRREK